MVHHIILRIKKNNFLVLGEGSADGINDSTGASEKKIRLTFVKQRQNFANDDESYFYVNKKEWFPNLRQMITHVGIIFV